MKKMSPAGSREPAMRWCARHSYEAANVLLSRITRFSKLKRWGMDVAKRRGSKRAKVALARKIGIILHGSEADRSAGLIKENTRREWAEHSASAPSPSLSAYP